MKQYKAEHLFPSHSGLGESPLYDASSNTLHFVDIKNHLVHSVPLSLGWDGKRTYTFMEPVTRLNLVKDRHDILAVQTKVGFALLELATGVLKRITTIKHGGGERELDEKVRMNDGGIDAKGRWWAGTMALDEDSEIGRLWCLENGKVNEFPVEEAEGKGWPVPNGPVWSPDDKTMYVPQTPQSKVWRYDYDVETGKATNKRLFVELEDGGMPDGLAVDKEGYVWAAANSKGKLVRFSPDGKAVAEVEVPGAKMCSCPAFGGQDMKTLFITSIADDGSSGDVYQVKVDVEGIPRHEYRLG
ncbi:putative SMP-30/Gluconolaconase/LRE-like region-domain-containing protein [Seiridium cardinale]